MWPQNQLPPDEMDDLISTDADHSNMVTHLSYFVFRKTRPTENHRSKIELVMLEESDCFLRGLSHPPKSQKLKPSGPERLWGHGNGGWLPEVLTPKKSEEQKPQVKASNFVGILLMYLSHPHLRLKVVPPEHRQYGSIWKLLCALGFRTFFCRKTIQFPYVEQC